MKFSLIDKQTEKEFHVSWYIIAYKLCYGSVEFLSGLGLAFFGRQMYGIYRQNVARELFEDPHDLLAHISQSIVPGIMVHKTTLILTLTLLGLAKIAGAVGLMYKKNWGVDLLVGLTVIMFPFQVAALITHPSFFDVLYIAIGLIIALYLIEFKPKAWISRVLQKQW